MAQCLNTVAIAFPGGTYFFRVNLFDRRTSALVTHTDALRDAVRKVRERRPFHIDAWVVLPEHMHAMWTLPVGEFDYSARWRAIKTAFAKALPKAEYLSPARFAKGERGIWQRRFWEHTIRDEADYARHLDHVHISPLRHGLVSSARAWPHSSFHRSISRGIYPEDWTGAGDDDFPAGERRG